MITFDEPIPFGAALDKLDAKKLLPTNLASAELRKEWDAELRQRAMFSARTTKAEILQQYKDEISDMLAGKTNIATARARMQDLFDALDYDSERGHFGTDDDDDIPPADHGSLRDLSSRGRIDLVLQTNVRQLANFGFYEQGQSATALYDFPCYELVRLYPRQIPRGFKAGKGGVVPAPGEDWPSRWAEVGGSFYGGRMIARKDDPIWLALGSSFDDGLDAPWPPFAFNSGYGWREVPRTLAVSLGVISADDDVSPVKRTMNDGVQLSTGKLDPDLLRQAIKDLNVLIDPVRGKLKLRGLAADQLIANSGTTPGAIKGWITRRQGKQIAGKTFDEAMKEGGGATPAKAFLKVDSNQAHKIKIETGLDVAGNESGMSTCAVKKLELFVKKTFSPGIAVRLRFTPPRSRN